MYDTKDYVRLYNHRFYIFLRPFQVPTISVYQVCYVILITYKGLPVYNHDLLLTISKYQDGRTQLRWRIILYHDFFWRCNHSFLTIATILNYQSEYIIIVSQNQMINGVVNSEIRRVSPISI